ncbi:hypothetical protein ACIOEX_11090 [Streptomyces sp. NPDC087850]|uniref:MmyB family transcriptional regulator n=1 Tax=Streptomyces sp. NPDC087850 TaxID=3365809 RepID=UPI0037FBD816
MLETVALRGFYLAIEQGNGGTDRDADVGSMLREWRMARDPSLVPGLLAAHGTRRYRYLTQLDMAQLLKTSERWYRYLERGERRRYKRSMIDGIVRVLALSNEQASALYHFTGHDAPHEHRSTVPPPAMLVDLVQRQSGCVSYLSDEAWDVAAHNAVAGLHCPWLANAGANIMEWAFSPDARYQLRDWERSWAMPMLSELRSAWQRTPSNGRLAEVVADVRGQPGVDELWRRTAHVDGPYRGERPMFFPLVSREPVYMRLIAMGVYGSPAFRWIVMEPADPGIVLT